MKHRKRVVTESILTGAILILIAWVGGCASASMPPEPADSDMSVVRATHFSCSVGVEEYQSPVYSERLVTALRRTGLFDTVDNLERVPDAQLVARVQRRVYGTAMIPWLTGLTLGIVPTTVEEEWGEVFSLAARDEAGSRVLVDFTYKGPTTLGWVALLYNLSPQRTIYSPRKTERFRDALSVAICRKRDEIRKLLGE